MSGTEKHPRTVRILHWIHFPTLFLMIWSGLQIYWANDVYRIGPEQRPYFHFFPEALYDALGLRGHLAEGLAWHFSLMWIFTVTGLTYLSTLIFSNQWRKPKYGFLQQTAYFLVTGMGAGAILSGLAIFKPVQLQWLTNLLGGYEAARFEHFALMLGFLGFFLIHVTQVIRAGWKNFRGMVTGRDEDHSSELKLQSRRSFIALAGGYCLSILGWKWIISRPEDQGVFWPLRKTLGLDDLIFQTTLGARRSENELKKVTDRNPRINGDEGLETPLSSIQEWRLQIHSPQTTGEIQRLEIPLQELQTLPQTEVTFELKCIEGWSEVMTCRGVRFSDFLKRYHLGQFAPNSLYPYVALSTPDEKYYVSIDSESMMHPQTLLCTEMNGQLLSIENGAPLRLTIPVKYGIKHLKRIGSIHFAMSRPKDYWAERGYDWYAGL